MARDPGPSPLDAITSAVAARFSPRRIILYGSRARGDWTADSDYDLAVEVEGDVDEASVRRVIDGAVQGRRLDVDIYVCRPGELEQRGRDPGELDYDIVRTGAVLYAAPGGDRSLAGATRASEPPPEGWPSERAWLERARRDMMFIEHEVAHVEPLWDLIAFHAQQAVEKTLKAALVRANRHPARTHSLTSLLAELEATGFPARGLVNDCRRLEPYAVAMRYPTRTPLPTPEEGRALVDAARRVVAAVAPRPRDGN